MPIDAQNLTDSNASAASNANLDAAEIEAEMESLKQQQKLMQDMRIASILSEIVHALKTLQSEGTPYTIFLGTTGLTEIEQVELLKVLGEGELKISLVKSDEPADWYETLYSGIWVGTFHNSRGEATLRTIEVARFPEVASAQDFDLATSVEQLVAKAAELSEPAQ